MYHKNKKNINQSIENFLAYRKGLSELDKKIEAGVLVEEVNTINVDEAFLKVSDKLRRPNRTISLSWLTRIAAVLTIPLLFFTIWSLFIKNDNTMVENSLTWQEIQSPVGMRSHIVLPDGSDLWLNAGSKIRYGIPFIRENREVDLVGEAFLKVVKNENSPFIVNSDNFEVKVLGTQFNVKAYPEDEQIEVALKEGGIEFYYTKEQGQKVYTKLQPNDYLVLNKKNSEVLKEQTDLSKYIAWHQNILIFDDTPLLKVAQTMERWYGVEVVIANEEIKKYKFTTTFENEPLFRVIELLELSSPIAINYKAGIMDSNTNTISKSIVTINKK